MSKPAFRRHVSVPGLLSIARRTFQALSDDKPNSDFPLVDHLMSGLALFGLKYPSLLQFDKDSHGNTIVQHNLKTLYGIKQAPCDTYLRERLDELEPSMLSKT